MYHPAYTVRFTSGDMKGMTPAEVLFQNPENSAKLNEQFKFLKKNLKKYPKNQQQIDAILDASELVKKGELIKPNKFHLIDKCQSIFFTTSC